jgi:hypothetical protein
MKRPPYPKVDGSQPCAQTDPELFFPIRANQYEVALRAARKLCQSCVFQLECYQYALYRDLDGVWGGTTPQERMEARKQNEIEPFRFSLFNQNNNH